MALSDAYVASRATRGSASAGVSVASRSTRGFVRCDGSGEQHAALACCSPPFAHAEAVRGPHSPCHRPRLSRQVGMARRPSREWLEALVSGALLSGCPGSAPPPPTPVEPAPVENSAPPPTAAKAPAPSAEL